MTTTTTPAPSMPVPAPSSASLSLEDKRQLLESMGFPKEIVDNAMRAAEEHAKNSPRDLALSEFLRRTDVTDVETAWAFLEEQGPGPWDKDFKRRNGAQPTRDGWPMTSDSRQRRFLLHPSHHFNNSDTAKNMLLGGQSIEADNGR